MFYGGLKACSWVNNFIYLIIGQWAYITKIRYCKNPQSRQCKVNYF